MLRCASPLTTMSPHHRLLSYITTVIVPAFTVRTAPAVVYSSHDGLVYMYVLDVCGDARVHRMTL